MTDEEKEKYRGGLIATCKTYCHIDYDDDIETDIRGHIFHLSQDAVGDPCENAYQILSENGQGNH